MSTLLRRDPRTMVPDLIEWFEEPFMTLRPYLAQPIRVEDYLTADHYVVRAELAGLDPAKDVEVTVGSGYLNIHAERYDQTEAKHRSEFRYGSFTRSLPLPPHVNEDDVTASYADGILEISVGMHLEKKEAVKKIEVQGAKLGLKQGRCGRVFCERARQDRGDGSGGRQAPLREAEMVTAQQQVHRAGPVRGRRHEDPHHGAGRAAAGCIVHA